MRTWAHFGCNLALGAASPPESRLQQRKAARVVGVSDSLPLRRRVPLLRAADVTRVTREIKIFKKLEHPFLCRLYEVCNTKHHILLISEFASDGELFGYIVKHGKLREAVAARLFAQLIEGIDYLHDIGVVHRDLKVSHCASHARLCKCHSQRSTSLNSC